MDALQIDYTHQLLLIYMVQKGLVQASGVSEFLAEGLEGGFVVLAFASRFVKKTLYKANKNEIHKQKEYFV